nr:hypothetical protein [Tanacetum cinerariifolium]
ARRSFRALRGLVRLQGVVRGQNVKRQTVNAMKQMQLLVRVQTQIQSRRIQMLENQAGERQYQKNEKEDENSIGKWTFSNLLEAGDEHWDDSLMTKEEKEAMLQKKMEAVIKRERAMAYAYSHQLWKSTPKTAQNVINEIRSGGFPWWWNWLERQLPSDEPMTKTPEFTPTPTRTKLDNSSSPSPRPQSSTYKHTNFSFGNLNTPTPKSSRSTVPTKTRQPLMTPTRTPPSSTPNLMKFSKPKGSVSGSPYPMKDDDSLMSCPPFSVPNYMSPTVSAKAKVRPTSNPKDRLTSTAASETSSKRRFSFPLTQNIGSTFKWNKKSSSKDSTTSQAPIELEKKYSQDKKGRGKVKYGESRSFIPLFREPSSIEKILGEVDQQYMFIGNPMPVDQPTTPQPLSSPRPASPRVNSHRASSPRLPSPRVPSPRAVSPKSSPPRVVQRRTEIRYRPEPTLRRHHLSATIIQAAYRGYMVRFF